MTADEFVKILRRGPEKLRVAEVVLTTGEKELHGKGTLQITQDTIQVTVTFAKGEKVPDIRTGIFTKKDNWRMAGLIEDALWFKCDNVHFPVNTNLTWPEEITRSTFDLHPIDLVPSGWAAITRAQREELVKQHQANTAGIQAHHASTVEADTRDNVSFYARLLQYPLYTSTWGKEIKGETEYFEYVLTKADDTSDLQVSLESRNGFSSQGEQEDWRKFYAFMNALAFINGTNAWPYRIEYWRAGQKLIDRVTAPRPLSQTIHAPFPERLAFNARTGSIKWNFQDTIKIVTAFFESQSALSEEVAYIMFLFRQAGSKGVHRDITTVTLCVLFENLIRHIFKELKLSEKARSEHEIFGLFELAKKNVIDQMDQQLIASNPGYKRVYDVLRSAEVFNAKHMLQTIVHHFGLQWENDMELVFKTWQEIRHVSVHHSGYATRSDAELKKTNLAESRIAGAINMLLLKLFGYSGYMRHSAFEDGYRQI